MPTSPAPQIPTWLECRKLVPRDLQLDLGPLGLLTVELELSEEFQRVAREDLRETDDVAPDAIAALRRLLLEEKDLIVPLDDEYMRVCLRPMHYNVEAAFEKIRNFFAFKSRNPIEGRRLPPHRVGPLASSGIVRILPRRDQQGRRILLAHTGRMWDPKKISIEEMLCITLMCMEISLVEPNTQVAGVVIVWDLDGLTLSQVLKFTPSFAKKLLHFIQECIPLRIKAFHFVNQSTLFDIAYNVFKPFLKDKLRNRLFFHGRNLNSLTEHVDPKALPKSYGGEKEMHFDPVAHINVFRSFDPYFEALDKFGYTKPLK